jgi:hypothetical protein
VTTQTAEDGREQTKRNGLIGNEQQKQRQGGDERQVAKAHQQPDDPVEAATVGKQPSDKPVQEGLLNPRLPLPVEEHPEQRHHPDPAQRPDVEVGAGQKQQGARKCTQQHTTEGVG